MTDNLSLHMAQKRKSLVAETTPTGIDIAAKVVKKTKITDIHIFNSVIYGMIVDGNDHFTLFRSDLAHALGQGISLNCRLDKDNLKMISNIKGNNNSLIYDGSETSYLFTNGDCSTEIQKIAPDRIDQILPTSEVQLSRRTDKCKQIATAKGKAEPVVILIYDNQISVVHLLDSKVNMAFNPIAIAEFMDRIPDIKFLCHFLFHLVADEALMEISFDKGVYWLRTVIQLTQDVSIEQFEPLQRIK